MVITVGELNKLGENIMTEKIPNQPLPNSEFSQEFLALLPQDSKIVKWEKSVMLRLQWIKDHARGEDVKKLLFRELMVTITGDDATCFSYLEESPLSPELRKQRLISRMEWEIKELQEFGAEHEDIIKLLQGALIAVQNEEWQRDNSMIERSAWKKVRDTINTMAKVQQALDTEEVAEQQSKYFAQWRKWFRENEYKVSE
jgi:hypothetical protein